MARNASARHGKVLVSMLGHGRPNTLESASMLGLGLDARHNTRHKLIFVPTAAISEARH